MEHPDFIKEELTNYPWRIQQLEEELALSYITFDEYIRERSILDYDRKQLRKQNKLNQKSE